MCCAIGAHYVSTSSLNEKAASAVSIPSPVVGAVNAPLSASALGASSFAVDDRNTVAVHAPSGTVSAELAISSADQERGLGGRDYLAPGDGMLFVFDTSAVRGFWMKDMNFPIDIVWIDNSRKVVGISERIATSTYPDIFLPEAPVSYVLEVAASDASSLGIATGTLLTF